MTVVNSQDGNPSNGTKFNVINAVYNGGPGAKTIHGVLLNAGEIVLTLNTNHNLQNGDIVSFFAPLQMELIASILENSTS